MTWLLVAVLGLEDPDQVFGLGVIAVVIIGAVIVASFVLSGVRAIRTWLASRR